MDLVRKYHQFDKGLKLIYLAVTRGLNLFLLTVPDEDRLSHIQDDSYTIRHHPRPFRPWNASCTSINGTEGDYLSREERWQDMLEKAGFANPNLRRPIGPPQPNQLDQTNIDIKKRTLNPWMFKYNTEDNVDTDQPTKSLTSFTTKVKKF